MNTPRATMNKQWSLADADIIHLKHARETHLIKTIKPRRTTHEYSK